MYGQELRWLGPFLSVLCEASFLVAAIPRTFMFEYEVQHSRHLSSTKYKSTHSLIESHAVFSIEYEITTANLNSESLSTANLPFCLLNIVKIYSPMSIRPN